MKVKVIISDFSEKMGLLAEASKIIRGKASKSVLEPRGKRRENPLKRKYRWIR